LALLTDKHGNAAKLAKESQELFRSLGPNGRLGYAYARYHDVYSPVDIEEQRRIAVECLEVFRVEGDRFGVAQFQAVLGNIALANKEYERAQCHYEDMLTFSKEIGDLDGIAYALNLLCELAYAQGKGDWRAMLQESLYLFTQGHNEYMLGITNGAIAYFECNEGNYAQSMFHFEATISIGSRIGNSYLVFYGLMGLGWLALIQGNILAAEERFEECQAYYRKKDNKPNIAYSLYGLGKVAWERGAYEHASKLYTEALNLFQAAGQHFGRIEVLVRFTSGGYYHGEATVLAEFGKVALALGEMNQAHAYFEQVLTRKDPFPPINSNPLEPGMLTLEAMATLAINQGQMKDAVRLLGATEAWHKRVYYGRLPRERKEREDCTTLLQKVLSEQAFAAAWAEGQAMTPEQAVEYAQGLFHSEL
jgi:tetratricopeptide (TPR) repeat protein